MSFMRSRTFGVSNLMHTLLAVAIVPITLFSFNASELARQLQSVGRTSYPNNRSLKNFDSISSIEPYSFSSANSEINNKKKNEIEI